MSSNCQEHREYHLLLLNDSDMQVVRLTSRLTILGRDPSKDIAIDCNTVSREHATFLRVPSFAPNRYEYRIIDGGPSKNRSKNGITINGKSSFLHRLEHGDIISFSDPVKGLYLKVDLKPDDLKTYIAVLRSAKTIDSRTRDKILFMTRIFDKVADYLVGMKEPSLLNPIC